LVATFVRSGYPEAQEVKIDLLFFLELPNPSLILRMRCTVIFKERVATFFEENDFFVRVATRDHLIFRNSNFQ
jgi:hypothetical protein